MQSQNKIFWKECISVIVIAFVIASFVVGNLYAIWSLNVMLGRVERKIEISQIQHDLDVKDLLVLMNKGLKGVYINEKYQQILTSSLISVMKELAYNMDGFQKIQDAIQQKLDSYQTIDNVIETQLKEANVFICDLTVDCDGAGTHILIHGQSYILTCAHLIKDTKDEVVAKLDDGSICPLQLVKVNPDLDLALFKIYNENNFASLEIGTEEPKVGSQVFVVGNPKCMIDVITEGIVAKIGKEKYLITNITYFGNSGGALVYKNKLVGVVVELMICGEIAQTIVNYGVVVKLETIQAFIGSIK